MLNYAWRDAYGEEAPWVHRHPEAFTKVDEIAPGNFSVGRYFDPTARLHADAIALGGLPHGISEGMPAHEAYAAQWGSMSRALGLDAIMLRDSFGMPVPYQRAGPWGPLAPSPERIHQATDAVAALVRETPKERTQGQVRAHPAVVHIVANRPAHHRVLHEQTQQRVAGVQHQDGVGAFRPRNRAEPPQVEQEAAAEDRSHGPRELVALVAVRPLRDDGHPVAAHAELRGDVPRVRLHAADSGRKFGGHDQEIHQRPGSGSATADGGSARLRSE